MFAEEGFRGAFYAELLHLPEGFLPGKSKVLLVDYVKGTRLVSQTFAENEPIALF